MKHFRCKTCEDVCLFRLIHLSLKHPELRKQFKWNKKDWEGLNALFEEVQRIIGKTWIKKYS